eukprot:9407494-Heterocapsa_arctica.AAC.1
MKVIVEYNQIGKVCHQIKTLQELIKNKDKLCGGGPKTGCLMCRAIKETREMTHKSQNRTESRASS